MHELTRSPAPQVHRDLKIFFVPIMGTSCMDAPLPLITSSATSSISVETAALMVTAAKRLASSRKLSPRSVSLGKNFKTSESREGSKHYLVSNGPIKSRHSSDKAAIFLIRLKDIFKRLLVANFEENFKASCDVEHVLRCAEIEVNRVVHKSCINVVGPSTPSRS